MFKDINLLMKQNKSFAIYRFPNQQEPVLIVGSKENTHIVYSIQELNKLNGFVIAPFEITKQKAIICIEPELMISGSQNITQFLGDYNDSSEVLSVTQDDTHYLKYKNAFGLFFKALLDKEFEKLVLSHPSDFTVTSDIPYFSILNKAMDEYPSSFVYLCYTPQTGMWIGATPELLLKGSAGTWETVALAGTQEKKEDQEIYEWDNKNTLEQQIVSKYIKELLDSYGTDYKEQIPLTTEAGRLAHLRTSFSFQMADSERIISLIEKLHPTPAICGLPKEKAYRFIVENEGYDRSYYSGFIGYLDMEKETNLYVNLRCMKVESNRLRLYAGGGLLASSDFESEWKETEAKLQTMLSLLN